MKVPTYIQHLKKDTPNMPPTATIEDIKAYLEQVEKNQITPQNLPDCKRCGLAALNFKIHAYRERRFLIIVDMTVQPEHAPLVRFRCPACNKTVCCYPDFALPHKHYTRQSIMGFAENYFASEKTTYQQALMDGWGIIEGDLIQLENDTQPVRVVNFDYSTNTLTVSQSVTWTSGMGVSLAYNGSRPDIGAYEYGTSPTPDPEPTPDPDPVPDTSHQITSGSAIPTGYGAPYNVTSVDKELLVKATCGSTSVKVEVGDGNASTYVYNKGYIYRNPSTGSGQGSWQPFTLTGSNAVTSAWIIGKAAAKINFGR
jgi:hypothetical protein